MGSIGHDPLKYIQGGGLIPIGHVLITCPPSLQHRDLFPNRFGIGCIRELGVLVVHDSHDLLDQVSPSRTNFLRVRRPYFARLPCEPRGRAASASHDLLADLEVERHFPLHTTSVRTRRSGAVFRLARPLCELGGRASFSALHDLGSPLADSHDLSPSFARPRSVSVSRTKRTLLPDLPNAFFC